MHTLSRRSPGPRLLRPLRDFLAAEIGGAVVLAAAAIIALLWANSPWSGSYERLWESKAAISVAGHHLELDLRHWINDAVMTVFFLVVGLEIKRELTSGHLRGARAALLPLTGAIGGMAMPALIYLAIAGRTDARGWGVPVATDIALALGVVALAGSRVPASLRVFLLGLAIVDDIAAIIIIAVFYSAGIELEWLAVAAASITAVALLRQVGVHRVLAYVVVGSAGWFALYEAGVHPTLAGVAMGLLAPSTARLTHDLIDVEELMDVSSAEAARATTVIARSSVSVVEWLLHVLHPWTSFVIVPMFALANAGVKVSTSGLHDASGSVVFWGIAAGLMVGKPFGIVLACALARRLGAEVPSDAHPRQLVGVGAAAGVGFTVALFIAELAFTDHQRQAEAKLAILLASAASALIALAILGRNAGRSSLPQVPIP